MHADVSFAAAFLAGLVSFLSPCVLPLVPGYISMLSGVGMEQLRQGQQPRGGLFASALSFVLGFSAVFISFGASASVIGQFLVRNKTALAPFAGAIVILFGLHLIGALTRVPVKPDDTGEAVVQHEELQQHRRAPDDFDVHGEGAANHPRAVDAASGDDRARQHRDRHRQERQRQGF